jgi:hypothetical protein
MLLELLAAALLCGDALTGQGEDSPESNFPPPPLLFEEDEVFFDEDGDEHLVDEDGYCEDCDEYYDF